MAAPSSEALWSDHRDAVSRRSDHTAITDSPPSSTSSAPSSGQGECQALVPASAAVPTAATEQQHNDDNDQQCLDIHIALLETNRSYRWTKAHRLNCWLPPMTPELSM